MLGALVSAHAQETRERFELTADGFVSSADVNKSYIIIDSDGEQSQLYQRVKVAVTSMFRSPQDVISEAAPDMLTINGISEKGVRIPKALGLVMDYDVNFTISFRFKDGKVRIDAPHFTCKNYSGEKVVELILRGSNNLGFGKTVVNTIYNKKGDKYDNKSKKAVEEFFNELIDHLLASTEVQDSDW